MINGRFHGIEITLCWTVCQAKTVGSAVAFPAGTKITIFVPRSAKSLRKKPGRSRVRLGLFAYREIARCCRRRARHYPTSKALTRKIVLIIGSGSLDSDPTRRWHQRASEGPAVQSLWLTCTLRLHLRGRVVESPRSDENLSCDTSRRSLDP
jgi:hypothetical protein